VMVHQHGLEDEDASLERRLAAQPGLARLWRHQIEVMKLYVDNGDEERFAGAWRHWIDWARHWNPEHDLDDIELATTYGSGPEQQHAARELDAARQLLAATRALEDERARLMLALGVWALERRQQGALSADLWLRLVPYLIGAASDADAAVRILRWMFDQLELPLVQTWQLDVWDGQPGWRPHDSRLVGQLWGTLLLLRAIPPSGEAPGLDLGPAAADIGSALLASVDQIAADASAWEAAAAGQLDARAAAAHAAIEEAIRREAEQADQRLADAPLDPARVAEYAEQQRRVYAEGDYLRQRMLELGAVESEEDPTAFAGAGPGILLPKRPFVDTAGSTVLIDVERPAKVLAQQQLQTAYAALAELAQPVDGEGAEAAVQAIAELRGAGHEPDAVLLPRDVMLRAMLSPHPEWQWTHDFLRQGAYFATLAGVPVYDPGPREATAMVVCALASAARRVERSRPDDPSAVRVEIEAIDQDHAAELWEVGARLAGVPDERTAQEAALVRGYVHVYVDMDVDWRAPERAEPAARRIELPQQAQRERPRH
jgi:hypothetical protein